MQTVNEKSTCYLTVKFYDKDGNLSAPVSATFTVHDKGSKVELKAATPIDPIAEIVQIAIPASVNAMHDSTKLTEIRTVTVLASYGIDDNCNDRYEYQVANLTFHS